MNTGTSLKKIGWFLLTVIKEFLHIPKRRSEEEIKKETAWRFSIAPKLTEMEAVQELITWKNLARSKKMPERSALLTPNDRKVLLKDAIQTNNFEAVKELVQGNPWVLNYPLDEGGNTPLHLAVVLKSESEVIKFLIEQGADISAENRNKKTPWQLAKENDDKAIVDLLESKISNLFGVIISGNLKQIGKIEGGKDLIAKYVDGSTPLHWVIEYGKNKLKVMKFLIENGAYIDARTNAQETPLHWAVEHGYPEIVKFLIKRGADVNAQNQDGDTPLKLARDKGYKKVIKLLENEIARQQKERVGLHRKERLFNFRLFVKNFLQKLKKLQGGQALFDAIERGDLEKVKKIIDKEKSKRKKDIKKFLDVKNAEGETPLKLAKKLLSQAEKDLDLVGELKLWASPREGYDQKLVYKEILQKQQDKVKELKAIFDFLSGESSEKVEIKQREVAIEEVQLEEKTVQDQLFDAIQEGNLVQVVKIAKTLKINEVKDEYGGTPLHAAVKQKTDEKIAIINFLINIGVDVDAKDEDGNTPLHCATGFGYVDVVKLLVEDKNAKVDLKNEDGKTPLDLVGELENEKVKLDLKNIMNKQKAQQKKSPEPPLKKPGGKGKGKEEGVPTEKPQPPHAS